VVDPGFDLLALFINIINYLFLYSLPSTSKRVLQEVTNTTNTEKRSRLEADGNINEENNEDEIVDNEHPSYITIG